MSRKKESSGFDAWWNSPSVKRTVGAVYSIGASIVILGAMFKILHLPGAGIVLGIGMTCEAILFALGAFDKPFKEYSWDNIFDFSGNQKAQPGLSGSKQGSAPVLTESLSTSDVAALSIGIKNLSETAKQLNTLTDTIKPVDDFVRNLDTANKATDGFIRIQNELSGATQRLINNYEQIGKGVEEVSKGTKHYAEKVDGINKNLSSINSVYELHLKSAQAQSESLRKVNNELDAMLSDVVKIKASTDSISTETSKYRDGAAQLSKQISSLNQVYGNMLNSLN